MAGFAVCSLKILLKNLGQFCNSKDQIIKTAKTTTIFPNFLYIELQIHPTIYFIGYLNNQFSHSVVSNSLQPHGLQHTRPPCPSKTPGAYSTHVHQVDDAIEPSHPLSSPSPPIFNLSQYQGSFPTSQFFTSAGQSIGVSASASVLSMNK